MNLKKIRDSKVSTITEVVKEGIMSFDDLINLVDASIDRDVCYKIESELAELTDLPESLEETLLDSIRWLGVSEEDALRVIEDVVPVDILNNIVEVALQR